MIRAFYGAAFALFGAAPVPAGPDDVASDETVILFSTAARRGEDGSSWRLDAHGWIFELEPDSAARNTLISALRPIVSSDATLDEDQCFRERLQPFLADNERGKRLRLRLGEKIFTLGPSGADGHFEGTIDLSEAEVAAARKLSGDGPSALRLEVVTASGDSRRFEGRVSLVEPEGISVISDIDDTIKVSNVLDRQALLRNTLLRDFEAVPGVADAYTRWAREGCAFHYVSASPWQLYSPLSAFVASAGFPAGSFHLKKFRLKDSSVLDLLASNLAYKLGRIEPILKDFPRRRFVLVGDTGEQDPEVYGSLARKYPEQIQQIWLRDVTREGASSRRLEQAFAGVPSSLWRTFRDAKELPESLGRPPSTQPGKEGGDAKDSLSPR